jgi:hypothetical protein
MLAGIVHHGLEVTYEAFLDLCRRIDVQLELQTPFTE